MRVAIIGLAVAGAILARGAASAAPAPAPPFKTVLTNEATILSAAMLLVHSFQHWALRRLRRAVAG